MSIFIARKKPVRTLPIARQAGKCTCCFPSRFITVRLYSDGGQLIFGIDIASSRRHCGGIVMLLITKILVKSRDFLVAWWWLRVRFEHRNLCTFQLQRLMTECRCATSAWWPTFYRHICADEWHKAVIVLDMWGIIINTNLCLIVLRHPFECRFYLLPLLRIGNRKRRAWWFQYMIIHIWWYTTCATTCTVAYCAHIIHTIITIPPLPRSLWQWENWFYTAIMRFGCAQFTYVLKKRVFKWHP